MAGPVQGEVRENEGRFLVGIYFMMKERDGMGLEIVWGVACGLYFLFLPLFF
jgi:hypothetical protein